MGSRNEVVSLDSPNADFLGSDKFPVHALGPSKTRWAFAKDLTPWLEEELIHFDVIIQHGLWQYNGYALMRTIHRLRRLKQQVPEWYIYPHGMLDPWFQKARTRRLKAIRNIIYWKFIENRVIESADGLLFTCQEEMDLAATTFRPFKPKAINNVGYGISGSPSLNEESGNVFFGRFPHLTNQPFLLFLSRIHPKKGIDLLLEAYAYVKNSGTRTPPHLVIAGPCKDKSYWNRLQKKAVSLGLQNTPIPYSSIHPEQATIIPKDNPSRDSFITWTGMLTGYQKWGAFHGTEVLILPSHQENFGISVVEAMSCGKPVLISNKVNIWREVERMSCGLIADDTAEGTINLLKSWISCSENTRRSMGRNATDCYKSNFSIEQSAKKLSSVIGVNDTRYCESQ